MKKFTLRMDDGEHKLLLEKAGDKPLNTYIMEILLNKEVTASDGRKLDDLGFPIEEPEKVVNPYKGWWIVPDPDGGISGWFDDNIGKCKKVITNGKREIVLLEDNPIYSMF